MNSIQLIKLHNYCCKFNIELSKMRFEFIDQLFTHIKSKSTILTSSYEKPGWYVECDRLYVGSINKKEEVCRAILDNPDALCPFTQKMCDSSDSFYIDDNEKDEFCELLNIYLKEKNNEKT